MQEFTGPRQPIFKEEPRSPPKPSYVVTAPPSRRKVAVKTEPSDRMEGRYGGMVGEKVKREQEIEDMDTGMDGEKGRAFNTLSVQWQVYI